MADLRPREVVPDPVGTARPADWDPRARPIRWCPIWQREIHVQHPAGGCAQFCGKPYEEECKFSDREPKAGEMRARQPLLVADETPEWVRQYRQDRGPLKK